MTRPRYCLLICSVFIDIRSLYFDAVHKFVIELPISKTIFYEHLISLLYLLHSPKEGLVLGLHTQSRVVGLATHQRQLLLRELRLELWVVKLKWFKMDDIIGLRAWIPADYAVVFVDL